MHVEIGPYKSWFGPYQAASLLRYLGFNEDTCEKVGDWLPMWPFNFITKCKGKRLEHVYIHKYDTWNSDHTIALIVHPMLVQLQKTKHGSPYVDDADVPEELRLTNATPKENEWDIDDLHHKRWDWVLNEMVFAFHCKLNDEWEDKYCVPGGERFSNEAYLAEANRIQNGFVLFGKYFQNLWD